MDIALIILLILAATLVIPITNNQEPQSEIISPWGF